MNSFEVGEGSPDGVGDEKKLPPVVAQGKFVRGQDGAPRAVQSPWDSKCSVGMRWKVYGSEDTPRFIGNKEYNGHCMQSISTGYILAV